MATCTVSSRLACGKVFLIIDPEEAIAKEFEGDLAIEYIYVLHRHLLRSQEDRGDDG